MSLELVQLQTRLSKCFCLLGCLGDARVHNRALVGGRGREGGIF